MALKCSHNSPTFSLVNRLCILYGIRDPNGEHYNSEHSVYEVRNTWYYCRGIAKDLFRNGEWIFYKDLLGIMFHYCELFHVLVE